MKCSQWEGTLFSDRRILTTLETLTHKLVWISETDAPFVVCWMMPAPNTEPSQTIDEFFAPVKGDARYKAVIAMLKTLDNPGAYRIGEVGTSSTQLSVFIGGTAPSGRWIGLQTQIVET